MIPTFRFAVLARSAAVSRGSAASSMMAARAFSSECEPAQKLKCIFEEYRLQHFSRETPNRFRKELLKAAEKESDMKGAVEVDSLNKILFNIGRPERLSEEELNVILREAGANDRAIPIDKMIQLM